MKWFFKRMGESSSRAGVGMVLAGAAGVLANKADSAAWAMLMGGLGAFVTPEAAK